MPRDYRRLLANAPCWDQAAERSYKRTGILPDCMLQNREELIQFCAFIEKHQIRSYLEIGFWNGRLVSTLNSLFQFEKVGAADLMIAEKFDVPIHLPEHCQLYRGDSQSEAYRQWRQAQGHFDLVMIDGDHSYAGVKQDFENNLQSSFRFMAFHDISGKHPTAIGVQRFWQELKGHKIEILCPNPELGQAESHLGIGIWWP